MDKLYIIIICHVLNFNQASFNKNFGFSDIKSDTIALYNTQFKSTGVYIGKFNDNIVIASPEYVTDFFIKKSSKFKAELIKMFPKNQITILLLSSATDLYGYCLMKNSVTQRIRCGADLETYINKGNLLPEENQLKDLYPFSEEETKEFHQKNSKAEIKRLEQNEIGVRVTKLLLLRYFGKNYTEVNNNFNKILMTQISE